MLHLNLNQGQARWIMTLELAVGHWRATRADGTNEGPPKFSVLLLHPGEALALMYPGTGTSGSRKGGRRGLSLQQICVDARRSSTKGRARVSWLEPGTLGDDPGRSGLAATDLNLRLNLNQSQARWELVPELAAGHGAAARADVTKGGGFRVQGAPAAARHAGYRSGLLGTSTRQSLGSCCRRYAHVWLKDRVWSGDEIQRTWEPRGAERAKMHGKFVHSILRPTRWLK